MQRSVQIKGFAIIALAIVALCIWYGVFFEDRRGVLSVSFLDVGQGDSVYIETPSGRQVLIDGGVGSIVLRRLAKVRPWYDRTIDVVVATHPDADHIGGLVDVLDRYKVQMIVRSSVNGDTRTAQTLVEKVRQEGAQEIIALRGQIIDLGKGAYLEVLFPDRDVSNVETNDGCVITRLVYGETAFMLPCDASQAVENYMVSLDTANPKGESKIRSDVLKVGHHGSKNSSSVLFLGMVNPAYGIYSRGCNNRYGHPSPDAKARFAQLNIPTLDTCEEGTITFVSDGKDVVRIR